MAIAKWAKVFQMRLPASHYSDVFVGVDSTIEVE